MLSSYKISSFFYYQEFENYNVPQIALQRHTLKERTPHFVPLGRRNEGNDRNGAITDGGDIGIA